MSAYYNYGVAADCKKFTNFSDMRNAVHLKLEYEKWGPEMRSEFFSLT